MWGDRDSSTAANQIERWNNFLNKVEKTEDYNKYLLHFKQVVLVIKSFGISPFYYLTLPSYSKFAMFSLYDENSSNIFTLPDKNSVKIFRENIIGGLVNVYKRCIHIGSEDEKFPPRARKNIESK